jgi:hypothetical protein
MSSLHCARVRVAASATLVLIVLLAAGSSWKRLAAAPARTPEPVRLYSVCSSDWESPALVRLNPDTLQDMGRGLSLDLKWDPLAGFDARSRLIASPDGSTIAALMVAPVNKARLPPRDLTIETFDLPTGRLRAMFHPSVPLDVSMLHLAPGGAQIYGDRSDSSGPCRWNAVSATSAHVVSSFTVGNCRGPVAPILYDPAHRRLYVMDAGPSVARNQQTAGTNTIVLRAYDMPGGKARGSIKLPIAPAQELAWALSPNGRRIAVLMPDDETLELVNTSTMKLVRTERLVAASRGSSLLGRLAAWLGIAPSTALAKDLEGMGLNMVFSPDGRQLYLTGMMSGKGLGLRVVDVRTGTIVGDFLQGKWVILVQSSPDGRTLYALTNDQLDREGDSTLYRYDLNTHAITAQRRYAFEPPLIVVSGHGMR